MAGRAALRKPKDDSTQSPNDNSISDARPFHFIDSTLVFLLSLSLRRAVYYVSLICDWELLPFTACLKEIIQLRHSGGSLSGKTKHMLQRD